MHWKNHRRSLLSLLLGGSLFITSSCADNVLPRSRLPVPQLDPTVWVSSGSVLFDDQPLGIYDFSKIAHRPLCEFRDIFVDPGHIYFVPRPGRYREAITDLTKCCMPLANDADLSEAECNGSVKLDLCFCFHRFKFVPSVWIHAKERAREPSLTLNGTTWLMHHWSTLSHPDHFAMKLLELHGLVSTKHLADGRLNGTPYETMVDRISQLLSMDYPGPLKSDYEKFIMSLVYNILPNRVPYIFLNADGDSSLLDVLYDKRARLRHDIASGSSVPRKLQVAFVEHAIMSTRYKENVPQPYGPTIEKLKESLVAVSGSNATGPPGCLSKDRKLFRVAVLFREEGSGLRRFANINDMLLILKKHTKQSVIETWFVSSETPAIIQAFLFCSYHLLITPHSSQLANLVFSEPGVSVIEIQNPGFEEHTFLDLGHRVGLHYQLLKDKNIAVSPDIYPKSSDIVVDLAPFTDAVESAVKHLTEQGFVR